jgi:hypothetical protein
MIAKAKMGIAKQSPMRWIFTVVGMTSFVRGEPFVFF